MRCPHGEIPEGMLCVVCEAQKRSPCFPYGAPSPGQRNADDMGMPTPIKKSKRKG